MQTASEILTSIGEHPGRLVTLEDMLGVLQRAGFPTSRSVVHKRQMLGDGPVHFIYGNRAIYRLQDAIEWASRTRRAAQNRVAA
jgi:hypothetical protein